MQLVSETMSHNVAMCPHPLVLMERKEITVDFSSTMPFLITVLFQKYLREFLFGNEVLKMDSLSATSVLWQHHVLLAGTAGFASKTMILGSVLGCWDCHY